MKIGPWEISRTEHKSQFEDVLRQIIATQRGLTGRVSPDTCMKSPTVHAIVTSISRRLASSPRHVYRKTTNGKRESKERLPNHPVAKLLQAPNGWQSANAYWLDAVSTFVRYGRYFAWIGRGSTGPIRELIPLDPCSVMIEQDENYQVLYKVTTNGGQREVPASRMHYARGTARDFLRGDSPVEDVKMAIALEIAMEEFGASFFENGAFPLVIFRIMQGSAGFKTKEQEEDFIASFKRDFSGNKKHNAFLLPKGIETGDPIGIENDKAQYLESRRHQRTVIAGAFGVPPHLVGDLERATFNNVEQQDLDFTSNVVQPVAQAFESAMEQDLLTPEDRSGGVVIRFNLDAILRSDFKSRQEGLQLQRYGGVLSANEWREIEGKNPISDKDGGDDYMRPVNMAVAGEPMVNSNTAMTGEPMDNSNAANQSTTRNQGA